MPGSDWRRPFVGLLALLLPTLVLADYRGYARGQDAAEDGQWDQVEAAMQEALQANAEPKVRVKLYGQRFAPYVPQYYLGLVAYKRGDCATATRWFGDAKAASVIAQIAEFKVVADAARADCAARVAEPKSAPVEPAKPVVVSEPPAARPQVPTTVPPSNPAVTAKPSPPSPPSTPTAVVAAPLPTALQDAMRHWLAGRFMQVAAVSPTGLQGKALAHLHLLRAAAQFTMSEMAPAQADATRAAARQDILSARRAQPGLVPDSAYFSPRFRRYFDSVR